MRIYYRTKSGRFARPSRARTAWTPSGHKITGAARKAVDQARRPLPAPPAKPRRPVAEVSPIFAEFIDPAGIEGVSARSTRQVYALVQFERENSKFIYGAADGYGEEADQLHIITAVVPFKLPRETVAYWRAQNENTIISIVEAAAGENVAWIMNADGSERRAYHGLEVKKTHNDCRAAGRKLAKKRARIKAEKEKDQAAQKAAKQIGRVFKYAPKNNRPDRSKKVRGPHKPAGKKRRK